MPFNLCVLRPFVAETSVKKLIGGCKASLEGLPGSLNYFNDGAELGHGWVIQSRRPTPAMKDTLLATLLLACLLCSVTLGQTTSSDTSTQAAAQVQLTGTLEQRMAIGGETTGWALRYGDKKRVEVVLPAEAFAWIKDGVVVSVTGIHGTKHYLERGDVPVFIVKKISRVVP